VQWRICLWPHFKGNTQFLKFCWISSQTFRKLFDQNEKAFGPATGLAAGIEMDLFGVAFVLWAATYLLSLVMAIWMAALLVGAVLLVMAAVVISSSRSKLKVIPAAPEKTIRGVKDMSNGRNT
jgi:Flp pilus assembly protein TadB